MTHFDNILERVGAFGRYQIFHYILLGLAGIPAGFQNLANVFLVGVPDHWCHVTDEANLSSVDGLSHWPAPTTEQSGYKDRSCAKYDFNYSTIPSPYGSNATYGFLNATAVVPCAKWQYDMQLYGETLVTKWDLICARAWLRAVAQSLYMAGVTFGCIGYGSVADRIGRKPTWFISLVIMIVSGVLSAFMPEYWSHVFMRFVAGSASAGVFNCGFVLIMESIGKEYRIKTGVFYQGYFTVGYMILAGLAYVIKDFTWLGFTISIFPVVYIPLYWFMGESPRWLMSRNRREEAAKELERVARMNGVKSAQANAFELDHLLQEAAAEQDATAHANRQYSIVDLLRTPNMRKKSVNIFFNWFVNSLVYYGLSLGVSELAGSPYLNLFLSGVMEFPAFIFAVLTLDRLGRRWPIAVMMVGGGISCLTITLIPYEYQTLRTVLAMMGKLGISGSFSVIYVYSAELFPTVVRTIGVGSGAMSARIGGLTAPFVAELGKLTWEPLPMLVFGGSSVVAGLLALLLPETLNQDLPDTVEEGENFGKGKFSCFPNRKKREAKNDPDANLAKTTTELMSNGNIRSDVNGDVKTAVNGDVQSAANGDVKKPANGDVNGYPTVMTNGNGTHGGNAVE